MKRSFFSLWISAKDICANVQIFFHRKSRKYPPSLRNKHDTTANHLVRFLCKWKIIKNNRTRVCFQNAGNTLHQS